MYNFKDLTMYRPCRVKQHTVYAQIVKPHRGIYNKLLDYTENTTVERCVVLSGYQGEVWVISKEELRTLYMNPRTGLPVSESNLNKMRTDWVLVQSSLEQPHYYARFIPREITLTIDRGIYCESVNNSFCEHGLGDFIICEMKNGKAVANSFRCINGIVFANMFECKDLDKYIHKSSIMTKVPLPMNNFI